MSSANGIFLYKPKTIFRYECITVTQCCKRMKFSTTNRKIFPRALILCVVSEIFSNCNIQQVIFATFFWSYKDQFHYTAKMKEKYSCLNLLYTKSAEKRSASLKNQQSKNTLLEGFFSLVWPTEFQTTRCYQLSFPCDSQRLQRSIYILFQTRLARSRDSNRSRPTHPVNSAVRLFLTALFWTAT